MATPPDPTRSSPTEPSQADHVPVFVDCDPGIDDAVALAYLLCQDDVDVVGIAASGGNVTTAQVVRNALGWLTLAGRTDIPVHPGVPEPLAQEPIFADDTHGPTGAGYAALPHPTVSASETDAAHAWIAAARAHPGELIGIVLGPSTNLALALDIEPALPRLVKRLFIMGGAFNYRGNTRPTTEWNITWDPEAASRVIAGFGPGSAFLPVIGPIEATEAVAMTPDHLARVLEDLAQQPGAATVAHGVRGAGTGWPELLRQLGEALRFYFEFHEADGHGYVAHIHDPFVLAAAIGWARTHEATASPIPWATTSTTAVDVELTGTLTRGETVADWLGRWNRTANAEIIREVDAAAFLDHLAETLRRGPRV